MTQDEGYKILADSLLQTESTKGAYFLNKSKEMGIDPISFFTDLKSLYDTMEKHVNSIDHNYWTLDNEGNREAIYNTINLSHLSPNFHFRFFDKENIIQFLPGLEQFGQKIMNELKKDQTDKNRELIELLKIESESITTSTAKTTGLQSGLNSEQIENLNRQVKDWILPDYQTKFIAIEQELFIRGYIDNSHKWKKFKTDLAEFVCVVSNYKYFRPIVNGKRLQDFHERQFISDRYGYGKTGLSETWKKTKPKFDLAKIPFSWVEQPK